MTRLREVRAANSSARALRGSSSLTPLPLPDYTRIAPNSDEAIALLNEWRPTFFGYAAIFSDLAINEMKRATEGDYGLVTRGSKRELIPYPGIVSQKTRWENYRDLCKAFGFTGEAVLKRVIDSAPQRGLATPRAHAEQLLAMFRHLERGPRGRILNGYKSLTDFLAQGFVTSFESTLKFDHMVRNKIGVVPTDTHNALMRDSSFFTKVASMGPSGNIALAALSRESDPDHLIQLLPFDADGFKHIPNAGKQGKGVIEVAVPLDELPDPRTCSWDLKTGRQPDGTKIKDLPKRRRTSVGCLAMVPKSPDGEVPKSESQIEAVRDLTVEIIEKTGVRELPEGESARGMSSVAAKLAATLPTKGVTL